VRQHDAHREERRAPAQPQREHRRDQHDRGAASRRQSVGRDCGRGGHPLATADRVGLRALVEAGVADPGGTCGPQLAAGFTAHGVPWAPAHVVRDAATVLSMAAADITLGVLPALAAPSLPPPKVVLRPLDPPLSRSVYIHYRDTPEATRLGELLAQPGKDQSDNS